MPNTRSLHRMNPIHTVGGLFFFLCTSICIAMGIYCAKPNQGVVATQEGSSHSQETALTTETKPTRSGLFLTQPSTPVRKLTHTDWTLELLDTQGNPIQAATMEVLWIPPVLTQRPVIPYDRYEAKPTNSVVETYNIPETYKKPIQVHTIRNTEAGKYQFETALFCVGPWKLEVKARKNGEHWEHHWDVSVVP